MDFNHIDYAVKEWQSASSLGRSGEGLTTAAEKTRLKRVTPLRYAPAKARFEDGVIYPLISVNISTAAGRLGQ
jgi:hypothetical protein